MGKGVVGKFAPTTAFFAEASQAKEGRPKAGVWIAGVVGRGSVPGGVGKFAPTTEGRPTTEAKIVLWVGKFAPTTAFFAEASRRPLRVGLVTGSKDPGRPGLFARTLS